jgi:NAD(P)-dependent dehydrogenase (short-subunit alcohol dehydrogenase family)
MANPLERCTLITGGAGALGSGLGQFLLARGERVALLDRPAANAELQRLQSLAPERCLGVGTDVSSASAWQQSITQTKAVLGQPTGAALIAGGFGGGKSFHESDEQVWAQMMERNVATTQASLRAVARDFVQQKNGSIVVIGARPAVRPWEGKQMAEYAASKAAVVALAQAVASEVLEHNVRVNVVLPSAIDTAANRASMPKADFSRWVSVESLSGVIAFLLSDAARDISGAVIPVYGKA